MAAPKENLLSLGYLTGTERDIFTKQRKKQKKSFKGPPGVSCSTVMQLQQRWQELKQRELTAQQHNRQLLQQFVEAEDALREMLTLTADMKTIRMEYEQYLEDNTPRWKQQLKEKTQAAQRKRMKEHLRSYVKNMEGRVAPSADQHSLLQGSNSMPQKTSAPPKYYSPKCQLDYSQNDSPHLPYMGSSWQNHPQSHTAEFPITAPYHPHLFQLHHATSTPADNHHALRSNPPDLVSLQSWAAGGAGIPSGIQALWGQLNNIEELPPEAGVEEPDTSQALSSKRKGCGGGKSCYVSQELDIKPVRLSGGQPESSDTSTESSQMIREKRKKTGRSHCSSSEREVCSSQDSYSSTSSAVVMAAVAETQSSKSDASPEKSRTNTSRKMRSSRGLAVGSPRAEKVAKGSKNEDSGSHREENLSTSEELGSLTEESRSEKVENQSCDDKSESCGEESVIVSMQMKNQSREEIEKQKSSSSEQTSENGDEDDDGEAEEKERSQRDEEQEERGEEESERKNTTEDEEEAEEKGDSEEELSDSLKKEDIKIREKDSEASQDEEEDDDQSEGREEEEQRGEPEEESDSDDSIISPQEKSKRLHVIPEEASEDDEEENEGSETGSSDDASNEFSDDVEQLLAPQDQSQKREENDQRADEKPKDFCDNVEIFQVDQDKSTKSDQSSDSDEFDHFYS